MKTGEQVLEEKRRREKWKAKFTRGLNPFYGWRGPGTDSGYVWHIGHSLYYSTDVIESSDVKAIMGDSYEDFKKYYAAHAGTPRKKPMGHGPHPKWKWFYGITHVFDYALTHGMASVIPNKNLWGEV